jgi:hypothetical protein
LVGDAIGIHHNFVNDDDDDDGDEHLCLSALFISSYHYYSISASSFLKGFALSFGILRKLCPIHFAIQNFDHEDFFNAFVGSRDSAICMVLPHVVGHMLGCYIPWRVV